MEIIRVLYGAQQWPKRHLPNGSGKFASLSSHSVIPITRRGSNEIGAAEVNREIISGAHVQLHPGLGRLRGARCRHRPLHYQIRRHALHHPLAVEPR